MLKKIPYGISDYKELVEKNCYYIDKTMYLEKLENTAPVITYLRPGRFGKTLFTSMMFYYYDVKSKKDFDTLFKDTYIYKHPTKEKNSYYMLKFNFSGIETTSKKKIDLEQEFIRKVRSGLCNFNGYYNTDFYVDENKNSSALIESFFGYFNSLHKKEKLYILIDEYDNFTNAILEGNAENFMDLVGKNGIVKSFFATIKEYRENPVNNLGRFFMTGICPITLNSMTTGFNISTNLSTDIRFNSMIGLTHNEIKDILKDIDNSKEEIYNLMIKYYDGYLFNKNLSSEKSVFNATLVMYFLDKYIGTGMYPENLVDPNLALNYSKLERIIKINDNPYYKDILNSILKENYIAGNLTNEFNLEERYDRNDVISMLYYFGYLSMDGVDIDSNIIFRIPNKVNEELYNNYFIKLLSENNIDIEDTKYTDSFDEISYTGKIDKLNKYVEAILKEYSNRIFIKFDEKYIQLIYYNILRNTKRFNTYMEREFNKGYADIYIESNNDINKYNILIELKYISKKSLKERKEKISEGKIEIEKYIQDKNINANNLKKYIILYIGEKIDYIEER